MSANYTSQPARYAKNCIAVSCPSNDMFISAAALLARDVHARYSHREKAYIMTPGQFKRFEALVKGKASEKFNHNA